MRILVLGAGATGGYFGGRLLEAGRDVTFLVRPRRAHELAQSGLTIRSPRGDFHTPHPPTILADQIREPFDLILLSSKAYDLESAICSFTPAVGADTTILPVLNGIRHLDTLDATFTAARVLGGRCLIAATIDAKREIVHLNDTHEIAFGERDSPTSDRIEAIDREFTDARCDHRASPAILQDMWEKWVFLATLAASTCLCRASVGEICRSPGGRGLILSLFEEARSLSAASGYEPREPFIARSLGMLTADGSPLTASMLRDIEANAPIEADHIVGDLIRRGRAPLLSIAYTALKSYESRRARQ